MSVTVADTDTVTVAAGNGKVPSATPTDMFALDSRVRGNDGAIVTDDADAATDRATVAVTVATTGDGVSDGAIATVATTTPFAIDTAAGDGTATDTVTDARDETVAGEVVGVHRQVTVATGEVNGVHRQGRRCPPASHRRRRQGHRWSPASYRRHRQVIVVTGAMCLNDETVATGNGENKIVIPAGSGNPDARTARQIEAGSWTANAVTERTATPAAGDVADSTVGATHNRAVTVVTVSTSVTERTATPVATHATVTPNTNP